MKGYLLAMVTIVLLLPTVVFGGTVKLAWDPNTEADLAGYKLYYGTVRRVNPDSDELARGPEDQHPKHPYTKGPIKIGKEETTYDVHITEPGIYYFSLTAYDNAAPTPHESLFSNEVSANVQPDEP